MVRGEGTDVTPLTRASGANRKLNLLAESQRPQRHGPLHQGNELGALATAVLTAAAIRRIENPRECHVAAVL